jgi:hypothetical protein
MTNLLLLKVTNLLLGMHVGEPFYQIEDLFVDLRPS